MAFFSFYSLYPSFNFCLIIWSKFFLNAPGSNSYESYFLVLRSKSLGDLRKHFEVSADWSYCLLSDLELLAAVTVAPVVVSLLSSLVSKG